ncbi:ATP-dependent metallopeptidase FtsH/Yme1/Tma family protein, partial [Bacteriovoracaceae bacterium]|nr:ATP-dependent metallopeptidase FtsH/Yme1/Tma family protein [Bacteriovoracaceae bacterium]
VDLETIAKGTPGFTGADLANLVNEAALLAARASKKFLENLDFENAKDKVLMGVARKSMVISDAEKRVTAYHEAGHTVVGLNLPYTDPIHKVSIIPRGGALGVTQTLPNEDMLNLTKEKANNFIAFLMGGRVAEEITFNEITNGASNDIERATDLARNMVCSWGMSYELGPLNFNNKNQQNIYAGSTPSEIGPSTSQKIDQEVSKIVRNNYQQATDILVKERDFLERLSEALILWETLDANQINRLQKGEDIGIPVISDGDGDGDGTASKTEDKDSSSPGFVPPKNLSPA